MYLSVSIKATDEGYLPRLVYEDPKLITVYSVGPPCSTWKEAYIVARASASNHKHV